MAEYEHLRARREAATGEQARPAGPPPTPLSERIAREGGPDGATGRSATGTPPAVDAFRAAHDVAASVRETVDGRGRLARLVDVLRGRRSG